MFFVLPLLLENIALSILVDEVSSIELDELMVESSTLLFLHDLHEFSRFLQIKFILFFLFLAQLSFPKGTCILLQATLTEISSWLFYC